MSSLHKIDSTSMRSAIAGAGKCFVNGFVVKEAQWGIREQFRYPPTHSGVRSRVNVWRLIRL